jgi:hypothetical protein
MIVRTGPDHSGMFDILTFFCLMFEHHEMYDVVTQTPFVTGISHVVILRFVKMSVHCHRDVMTSLFVIASPFRAIFFLGTGATLFKIGASYTFVIQGMIIPLNSRYTRITRHVAV